MVFCDTSSTRRLLCDLLALSGCTVCGAAPLCRCERSPPSDRLRPTDSKSNYAVCERCTNERRTQADRQVGWRWSSSERRPTDWLWSVVCTDYCVSHGKCLVNELLTVCIEQRPTVHDDRCIHRLATISLHTRVLQSLCVCVCVCVCQTCWWQLYHTH